MTNYRFSYECRDKAIALLRWRRHLATRPVAAREEMEPTLKVIERFVLDTFEKDNGGVVLPINRIIDLAKDA